MMDNGGSVVGCCDGQSLLWWSKFVSGGFVVA